MIDEAIPIIRRLGYDAEEAEFLCLAAVHSGYFVRRQFNEFLGQERGGYAARFVQKLLQRNHARFHRYHLNRYVYHLRAKRIYNRLGQSDNRNRRDKAPVTIERKLMCLDFVLAHRKERFLSTEFEKVEYFTGDRSVPVSDLPARRYPSRNSGPPTDRYFVDKLPVYVSPGTALPAPVVHFAYIDEGAETTQGFETFLDQYGSLFRALDQFEVVYVATASPAVEAAQQLFQREFPGHRRHSGQPLDPAILDVLDYFKTRRQVDDKDFRGLDAQRISRLREERKRYAGEEFESLYCAWLQSGEQAIRDALTPAGNRDARFRGMVLPHSYEFCEAVRRAS